MKIRLLFILCLLSLSAAQSAQIGIAVIEFSGEVEASAIEAGLAGVDLARSSAGEPITDSGDLEFQEGKVTFLYRGPLLTASSVTQSIEFELTAAELTYAVEGDRIRAELRLAESSSAPLRKTRASSIDGSAALGRKATLLAVRKSSARIVSSDRAQRTKIAQKGFTRLLVAQLLP